MSSCRASTTRDTCPARGARRRARHRPRRPAHRPRPALLAEHATSSARLSCCRRRTSSRRWATSTSRTRPSSARNPVAAELAARGASRRPRVPGARQGAGRLRLAPHLPRATTARELDFYLAQTPADSFVQTLCRGEEFSIDVFCDFDGRCLNAIPRTMIESKGGESIKGMTIKDSELIEHGRRVAEALADLGAGEHPVLPRARRTAPRHGRQPSLRRRLSAPARGGQPLPGARARACKR